MSASPPPSWASVLSGTAEELGIVRAIFREARATVATDTPGRPALRTLVAAYGKVLAAHDIVASKDTRLYALLLGAVRHCDAEYADLLATNAHPPPTTAMIPNTHAVDFEAEYEINPAVHVSSWQANRNSFDSISPQADAEREPIGRPAQPWSPRTPIRPQAPFTPGKNVAAPQSKTPNRSHGSMFEELTLDDLQSSQNASVWSMSDYSVAPSPLRRDDRADIFYRRHRTAEIFDHWLALARARPSTIHAQNHDRLRLLRRAFSRLAHNRTHRQQAFMMLRARQFSLRRMFHLWRVQASDCRKLSRHTRHARLSRVFALWYRRLIQNRALHALSIRIQRRNARAFLFSWRSQACGHAQTLLSTLLTKCQTLHNSRQLQLHFHQWRVSVRAKVFRKSKLLASTFAIWRLSRQLREHQRQSTKDALAFRVAHLLQPTFGRWTCETRRRLCVRRAHLRLKSQCIYRWRLLVRSRQTSRSHQIVAFQRASAAWSERHLFLKWFNMTLHRRHQYIRAQTNADNRLLRDAWHQMCHKLQSAFERNAENGKTLAVLTHDHILNSFLHWKRLMLLHTCHRRSVRKTLSRMLVQWRSERHRAIALNRVKERVKQLSDAETLARTFDAWHHFTALQRQEYTALWIFRIRLQKTALSLAWRTWQSAVEDNQRNLLWAAKSAEQLRAAKLRRHFRAWFTLHRCAPVRAQHFRRRLRCMLQIWHQYAVTQRIERHNISTMMDSLTRRALGSIFQCWKRQVSENTERAAQMEIASRLFRTRRVLHQWKLVCSHCVQLRHVYRGIVQQHLAHKFQYWREALRLNRLTVKADRKQYWTLLHFHWLQWRQATKVKVSFALAADSLALQFSRRSLFHAFSEWRVQTARFKQACTYLQLRARLRCEAIALRYGLLWKKLTVLSKEERLLRTRFDLLNANRAVAFLFAWWLDHASQHAARSVEIVLRFTARHKTAQVARMFSVWKEKASASLQHKHTLQQLQTHQIIGIFLKWRRIAMDTRLLRSFQRRQCHFLLKRFLVHWNTKFVSESQSREMVISRRLALVEHSHLDAIARWVLRWKHQPLYQAFEKFRAGCVIAKSQRLDEEVAVSSWQSRQQRLVFSEWTKAVLDRRTTCKALEFNHMVLQRRVLSAWKEAYFWQRENAWQDTADEIDWAQQAIGSPLIKVRYVAGKVTQRHLQLIAQTFDAWRSWAQQRRANTKDRQTADSYHMRSLFQRWKRELKLQKELDLKLFQFERCSRLDSISRAFQTWQKHLKQSQMLAHRCTVAEQQLHGLKLLGLWRIWCRRTKLSSGRDLVVKSFQRKVGSRRLRSMIVHWQNRVTAHRDLYIKLERCQHRFQSALLTSVWHLWMVKAQHRHRSRRAFFLLRHAAIAQDQKLIFDHWRNQLLTRQRTHQVAISHSAWTLLTGALQIWRVNAKLAQFARQVRRRDAFLHWRSTTAHRLRAHRVVEHWLERTRVSAWHRRLTHLQANRRQRCVRQAASNWLNSTRRQLLLNTRLLPYWNVLRRAAIWSLWQAVLQQKRRMRALEDAEVLRVQTLLKRCALQRSFAAWMSWTKQAQLLALRFVAGSQVRRRGLVISAWRLWKLRAAREQHTKIAAHTHSNRILGSSFFAWRRRAARNRVKRQLIVYINYRCIHTVRNVFHHWSYAARRLCHTRMALEHLQRRNARRALKSYFQHWLCIKHRNETMEALAVSVVNARAHALLVSSFCLWLGSMAHRRAQAERRQFDEQLQSQVLWDTFRRWRIYAAQQVSRRLEDHRAYGHYLDRLRDRAFVLWRDAAARLHHDDEDDDLQSGGESLRVL